MLIICIMIVMPTYIDPLLDRYNAYVCIFFSIQFDINTNPYLYFAQSLRKI